MSHEIITIVNDEGNRDYIAVYVDDDKILDAQSYEVTPARFLRVLQACGFLTNVAVEEVDIEFEDKIEFPDKLSDLEIDDAS